MLAGAGKTWCGYTGPATGLVLTGFSQRSIFETFSDLELTSRWQGVGAFSPWHPLCMVVTGGVGARVAEEHKLGGLTQYHLTNLPLAPLCRSA